MCTIDIYTHTMFMFMLPCSIYPFILIYCHTASPGVKDVNCRQLCFSKYQMLVFRSRPLARNDSVDVITGTGIVLVLPNGFGSGIVVVFDDSYILLPICLCCLFLFSPLSVVVYRRFYCLNMYHRICKLSPCVDTLTAYIV